VAEFVSVPYDSRLAETLAALTERGLLLVTQGADGRANAMAIGWLSVGSIWGMPVATVLVRPSRHTFKLLQQNGDFTVNVLPPSMAEVIAYCGTVSGRDHDKLAEKKLTPLPGLQAKAPILGESVVAYECRTALTSEVAPDRLDEKIRGSAYAKGDFHRIFFGKILAVRGRQG